MEQFDCWIEMDDGVRLAASVWLPDQRPVPCLLEALPYRKDDITASYGETYELLAREGFAACRVDVRGTGSSGGIATDEYGDLEVSDLTTVIKWLAAQDWCTGRVGMFGTSYSGFNSLHLAAAHTANALAQALPARAGNGRQRRAAQDEQLRPQGCQQLVVRLLHLLGPCAHPGRLAQNLRQRDQAGKRRGARRPLTRRPVGQGFDAVQDPDRDLLAAHGAQPLVRTRGGRFPADVTLAVSYTHRRAHETVLDLLCRLMLEKKTKYRKKEEKRMGSHERSR